MKSLRHALAVIFALAASASLGACGTSSYMGIPVGAEALNSNLRELALRARAGDKQAQLELGIAFEEGRGVERNLNNARKLYGQASAEIGGSTWLYVPPSGREGVGRVALMDRRLRNAGLREARARLDALADGGDGRSMSRARSTDASPHTRNMALTSISGEVPRDLDILLKAWRSGDVTEVHNWQSIEVPLAVGFQSLPPLDAVTEILDPDRSILRKTVKVLSVDSVGSTENEYRVTVSADLLMPSPCLPDPYSDDGASICFQHNIKQSAIKSFYYEVRNRRIIRLRSGISTY